MPRKRRPPEFIPADPDSPAPPLPRQHRLAVERAEARIAGRPPRPVAVDVASVSEAQIDALVERFDQGKSSVSDPDPGLAIELIREGARRIKADRQKVQPAEKAEAIKRRQEFLIQEVTKLPSRLKRHLTGEATMARLVRTVSRKLGRPVMFDTDAGRRFSATIRHDIRLLPIFRAVREQAQLEQKTRRQAVARNETAERERLRQCETLDAAVMRDRLKHVVFRFNRAVRRLNPKCRGCIAYNGHHTPNYWGTGQPDPW